MTASQRHKCEIHGRSSIGNSDCPPYGGAGGDTPAGEPITWSPVVIQVLTANEPMEPVDFDEFTQGSDPITYSVTSGVLPTGLELTAAGVLSGMPTTVGVTPLVVSANNGGGPVPSSGFDITVVAA